MDRRVSPRVAFWLTSFEPEMEAVAAEVQHLRRAFPGSVAWGVDSKRLARFSWKRGFSVHPKLQAPFRIATGLLQEAFHLNHIFGGLGDWFHLRAIRRRPTVLTVAVQGRPVDRSLLTKVDQFVVEWPGAQEELVALGVDRKRTRLIFPPVDLERFKPTPKPSGPFRVLFASSPERADWLSARGVDQLLDAAALRPQMKFRLLWRPWGDSLPVIKRWIRERSLSNVELIVGRVDDMAAEYAAAHATVAPFQDMERCKPAPNSIVESLAAGRPVLVGRRVGLAKIIQEDGAGLQVGDDTLELAESLDWVDRCWEQCSQHARTLAEKHFGMESFLRGYSELYEQLTRR